MPRKLSGHAVVCLLRHTGYQKGKTMAYSELDCIACWVAEKGMPMPQEFQVNARGGNRRQRGAVIGAHMRSVHPEMRKHHISYSETPDFQTATYIRYQR